MGAYSKFISERRRPVPTPKSILKPDGTCWFGTFQSEFEELPLERIDGPTALPNAFNRLKLTLWEATEVHLREGVLLAVVCDVGIFGKTFHIFYDKRDHKVYTWDTNLKSADTHIAPNLVRGAVASAQTPVSFVRYVNRFDEGRCELSGRHEGPCLINQPRKGKTLVDARKENAGEASIEYSFELERLSPPGVVSIPFCDKRPRPLYSQKDFCRVKGSLTLNGEALTVDSDACAVVDDHRGYYPRRAHYDWVTTMGKCNHGGQDIWLALNLTRNQTQHHDDFNENVLWLEGRQSLLPPVEFTRAPECRDFEFGSIWTIRDEHGMVDIEFTVVNMNPMVVHALVVDIDYYVTYGSLSGYVLDEDGEKYVLDGMMGMGEDKTMLL